MGDEVRATGHSVSIHYPRQVSLAVLIGSMSRFGTIRQVGGAKGRR